MKLLILYSVALPLIVCYVRHTNIKCDVLDKSLCEVPVSRLKVIGRGIVGLNLQVNILKPPVTQVMINYSVWKKLNGYHPFLFNVTVDFCHYMKHPNPINVFYYFHRALMPFSNMNHTCPYSGSVIVKDFVLSEDMFDKVPIPKGSYMFNVKFQANSIWGLDCRFYLDVDVKQTLRYPSQSDK